MTKQALNYLLGELERRGYLERRPDPDDRRSKRVALTPRAALRDRRDPRVRRGDGGGLGGAARPEALRGAPEPPARAQLLGRRSAALFAASPPEEPKTRAEARAEGPALRQPARARGRASARSRDRRGAARSPRSAAGSRGRLREALRAGRRRALRPNGGAGRFSFRRAAAPTHHPRACGRPVVVHRIHSSVNRGSHRFRAFRRQSRA